MSRGELSERHESNESSSLHGCNKIVFSASLLSARNKNCEASGELVRVKNGRVKFIIIGFRTTLDVSMMLLVQRKVNIIYCWPLFTFIHNIIQGQTQDPVGNDPIELSLAAIKVIKHLTLPFQKCCDLLGQHIRATVIPEHGRSMEDPTLYD
jgi:hypothetical protein